MIHPLTLAERLAGAAAAVLIGLAAALVLWLILPREARGQTVVFDCFDLARAIAAATDFRDAGADLEKTVRIARTRSSENGEPDQKIEVYEREIRRMWTEKKKRGAAVRSIYNRCRQQLGDMGREN